MYSTLLIEKPLCPSAGKDPFVPNIRMNVQAAGAVEVKGLEVLWSDIIAGQGKGHNERPAIEWKKELSAIRMIVGVP
jgi:hypothetical protein